MRIGEFTYRPPQYIYKAQLVRAYDGDTMWAHVDQGLSNWRHDECFRLYGIDTWEVRGEEREAGLIAKARFLELLPPSTFFVLETIKDPKRREREGKYGRYLAVLYAQVGHDQWVNVNNVLLQEGHAVEEYYD